MKKEKNICVILIILLALETSIFIGYYGAQQLFMKNYEASIEKARYVDEMAKKDYAEWRRMKGME